MIKGQFVVKDTFVLGTRSIFFLCGEIVAGEVAVGLVAELAAPERLEFRQRIDAVEFRDFPGLRRTDVCLGFQYANSAQLDEWHCLTWSNSRLLVYPSSERRLDEPTEQVHSKDPPNLSYARIRVKLFATSEGGRTSPILPRPDAGGPVYMPHLRILPGGEYLGVAFVDGPSVLHPGDEAVVTVALKYEPEVDYAAVQPDVTFAVVEGPRAVGTAVVIERWARVTDSRR
jgi:hypothetical protein